MNMKHNSAGRRRFGRPR